METSKWNTTVACRINDDELLARLSSGGKVESVDEMSPGYLAAIVPLMQIAADLELTTMGIMYPAFATAPDLEAKMAIASSIQDEMGHGMMMYRMLEDFGYDTEELLLKREPSAFKSFYVTQFPARDYIEFVVTQFIGDRAGLETTLDLEENCSYAPYNRSLRKVNFEEKYHVGHGEREVRRLWETGDPEIRSRIQGTVDWLFPLYLEWFGVSDQRKTGTGQLAYKIRGRSNDEMRQRWLSQVGEACGKLGIRIPARFNDEEGTWNLEFEMPVLFDSERLTWDLDRTVTWDEKMVQWKTGGPLKVKQFEMLQEERWGDGLWQKDK